MKVAFIITGLVASLAFASTASAQDVTYQLKTATDDIVENGSYSFVTKSELRLKENIEREFQEARGKNAMGEKERAEKVFISACERVSRALLGKNGPIKESNLLDQDKIVIRIPVKLDAGQPTEQILTKVCHGGVETESRPDNAASSMAITIHGGWSCHDTNNQVEESHGANVPQTGTFCP
jgi:hypothetical protein